MTDWPEYPGEQRTLAFRCSHCEAALTGEIQASGMVTVDPCPNGCKATVTPDRSTKR